MVTDKRNMKTPVKTISILFLVYFLLISFLISGATDKSINIQLRVNNKDNGVVSPDNLKLFINKQEVKITGLKERERFISEERLLGRNFVLSFMNFDNVDKILENAISYFITEVLQKSDSLIVHTNVDVYQIKVTENKERMILDIKNHLKKDIDYLSRKLSRILKNIDTDISKLDRLFRSLSSPAAAPPGGMTFFQFFSNLIPDIQFYRNEFIIPDKNKFNKIHDLLGFREGDRYWILIQNGNVYPFMGKINSLVQLAQRQLSSNKAGMDSAWAKMVNNKIRELMDIIEIGSTYPSSKMKNGFVKSNTSFFSVVYSVENAVSSEKMVDVQLEEVLKKLSEGTGGQFVKTSDIEKGIESITREKDQYWDVGFDIPAVPGKMKLKMTLDGSTKGLVYREKIEEEELKELIKYLSKSKIYIKDLVFIHNKLSFSINSFILNKRGGFGLLKVKIQIYDNTGKEVYRRSNILRADEKKIKISTLIPEEFSSEHEMKVSVLDMISNKLVVRELKTDK